MDDLSGRTLGEFILREPIGEGGHALVYRGEQPALQREVAIKVLRARRRNDTAQDRFLREAKLASRLDHPYAAHVYAFGAEDDGLLWIAMERVHGITLAQRLEHRGPMPLEQLVPFFDRVAEVVQAAHERGIIHRDLKPSNIMIVERGGRLLPKLLDFGIAKVDADAPASDVSHEQAPAAHADRTATAQLRVTPAVRPLTQTIPDDPKDHRLTRTGIGIGSAPYMSPEQWTNANTVGPATDLYSLGIILYEALTGNRPFQAEATNDYYRLHLRTELPPLNGDFSPDLDRILRRAAAKDPAARYHSVQELASDLRTALRTQPGERIRSLAQVWNDSARPSTLLLKTRDLLRAPASATGELERAFVAESRRYATRRAAARRTVAAMGVALVIAAVWYRGELKADLAEQQARAARQITEATITESELEQGRAALLHGEPEAQRHLAEAYRRAPTPSTAFMLARAMQPRLAEQARLPSSFGRMWSAAFSPDGKQVVTTDDKNAQIWDAQTYRLRFTLPHGDIVYQAVYSSDGRQLVTACGDGAVRIWDPTTGKLTRVLRAGAAKIRYYAVTISSDDMMIASIDIVGVLAHVWRASTGALLAELHNDGSKFSSAAFSSGSKWLATSGGNDVRIFDTDTWKRIITIQGPGIDSLSWAPSAEQLLTGSLEGDISLWNIPSGTRAHHLRDIGEPVYAVGFSADSRLVAAGSRDGTTQVWEASSGKLRSQSNHLHSKILFLEFDATAGLLALAGASGSLAIVDPLQGMPVAMLDGPRNVVMTARFAPSSHRVVSASWDGTARIWDGSPTYRQWASPKIASDCDLTTGLEPDRRIVAIGCGAHPTRIWDTEHDQFLAELPSVVPPAGDFASAYPAVSPAGDRAAIARGHTVEVYAIPGGRLIQKVTHEASVNTVAFSGDGHDLVTGAVDGSLLVTHDNGAQLALPKSSAGIDSASYLPDGRVVAIDTEQRLRIYSASGALLAELTTAARTRAIRISPSGHRLITIPRFVGVVAPPEIWDIAHFRLVARLEDQGQGRVFSSRFVNEDDVLTFCSDGVARRWDGATGILRQRYVGGSRFLADGTVSPDGSLVVAGDGDGLLRFWDASSGRQLWTMPAHKSHVIAVRMEGNDLITRGFSGDIFRWRLPDSANVIEACRTREHCAIVLQ